ncbi:MAG TPA: rod shape-determining protein MreC [Anaerolineales bacterium]|nr:rod shape-determining protein MreC [Anaerolineales bacterium]
MKDLLSRSLQTTIIFLIVGGILALALGGYFGSVSNWLTGLAVNAQSWFSSRYTAIQDLFAAPRDVAALRQRVAELESQNATLRAQIIELSERASQVETLSALLDYARANPESNYVAADVIGRDPSPFLHYIIINRGSNDGVLRGMPVVTDQGLVGRVDAVIADAARVQLITDPLSVVNVRLKDTDVEAALNGSVTGDLSLGFIPQDVTVEAGSLALTSGLGGAYPTDLIIGQVTNVRKREAELFQQASVQPAVDFSRLSIVLIITNFRPVDIAPLVPTQTP